ncbi:hypothetical protein SPBR_04489 [Sporothrix brasiliensis 5110]|uniref:Uncharacterized protein n=1 Tax=Sporothrix brasiliensis 5110 TaxID=1398154 RepID=A0A0C2J923_9PEZI|nr:uncharacterized protein SPBR_04489 [Sporothrix brasiliensis 5110]KIH93482.1 hypothetical protein SPBR_04489 [Sporothrix brasiliensis 5110]
MDRKEKEKRRQRWGDIIEMAEKKENDIRNGGKGRLDGQWVEDKEEASDRTRAAVLSAMTSRQFIDSLQLGTYAGSDTSLTSGDPSVIFKEEGEGADDSSSSSSPGLSGRKPIVATSAATMPAATSKGKEKAKVFFAFDDEDDEFLSSDEDDSLSDGQQGPVNA